MNCANGAHNYGTYWAQTGGMNQVATGATGAGGTPRTSVDDKESAPCRTSRFSPGLAFIFRGQNPPPHLGYMIPSLEALTASIKAESPPTSKTVSNL